MKIWKNLSRQTIVVRLYYDCGIEYQDIQLSINKKMQIFPTKYNSKIKSMKI